MSDGDMVQGVRVTPVMLELTIIKSYDMKYVRKYAAFDVSRQWLNNTTAVVRNIKHHHAEPRPCTSTPVNCSESAFLRRTLQDQVMQQLMAATHKK